MIIGERTIMNVKQLIIKIEWQLMNEESPNMFIKKMSEINERHECTNNQKNA